MPKLTICSRCSLVLVVMMLAIIAIATGLLPSRTG